MTQGCVLVLGRTSVLEGLASGRVAALGRRWFFLHVPAVAVGRGHVAPLLDPSHYIWWVDGQVGGRMDGWVVELALPYVLDVKFAEI